MAKERPIHADPWCPIQLKPGFKKAHAALTQRFFRGELDKEGQQQFARFLVEDLCDTYDLSYRPDSDRNTAFAEGKRFVGMMLRKLLHPALTPEPKIPTLRQSLREKRAKRQEPPQPKDNS